MIIQSYTKTEVAEFPNNNFKKAMEKVMEYHGISYVKAVFRPDNTVVIYKVNNELSKKYTVLGTINESEKSINRYIHLEKFETSSAKIVKTFARTIGGRS